MTDVEREDAVSYKINKAKQALDEVRFLSASGYFNTAISRMYYACFYASTALLLKYKIEAKSHEGVRQMIGKHFVLTNKLSAELGHFYKTLSVKRNAGDYDDFIDYSEYDIKELLPKAEEYFARVKELISPK